MKGTKGLFRLGMVALALAFMVLAGCDNGSTTKEEEEKKETGSAQADYYGTWEGPNFGGGSATKAVISETEIKFSGTTGSGDAATCDYTISKWEKDGENAAFNLTVTGGAPAGDGASSIDANMQNKTKLRVSFYQENLMISAWNDEGTYTVDITGGSSELWSKQ